MVNYAIFVIGSFSMPIAKKLKMLIGGEIHAPMGTNGADETYHDAIEHLLRLYQQRSHIVGICSSGILIRAVAPALRDKNSDPILLSVAEDGSAVVPLLGGHRGANDLARLIAEATGCKAAITTASDVALGVSLDDPPPGYVLGNREDHKPFVRALLDGAAVKINGSAPWLSKLKQAPDAKLQITVTERAVKGSSTQLVYHPQVLAVGLGCERGTEPSEVEQLIERTLMTAGLSPLAVACYASGDIKSDEPAIANLMQNDDQTRFFSQVELKAEAHRIVTPSIVVEDAIGVPSVAEASALAAVGDGGRLIVPKTKSRRATCAIARSAEPIVTFRGKPRGRLNVVGVGPGHRWSRSRHAELALVTASDWVGYGLYLDLVADLKYDQIEHRFPLGAEEDRVRHAIKLAKEGKRVALICSGDAGIYAMASLVYEIIDLEPCRIAVDVIPGISAFQAAAAKAGAMIGHDFCCISLSDLLTPWEVIEKRVRAAAEGDFVVSFYNPRSLKRRDQLERAIELLTPHRTPDTPIVVASNLGRLEEKVKIVRFADFNPDDVDMLTLVMVGSSQSKSFARGDGRTYAYTPRGYAKKRDLT